MTDVSVVCCGCLMEYAPPCQGDILEALSDAPNTIRLLGRALCNFQGVRWEAILLWPFMEHLSAADGRAVVAQVGLVPSKDGILRSRSWFICGHIHGRSHIVSQPVASAAARAKS